MSWTNLTPTNIGGYVTVSTGVSVSTSSRTRKKAANLNRGTRLTAFYKKFKKNLKPVLVKMLRKETIDIVEKMEAMFEEAIIEYDEIVDSKKGDWKEKAIRLEKHVDELVVQLRKYELQIESLQKELTGLKHP